MGIARMPLFKTDVVHFDIFAGAGANKTAVTLKSATQDGKLEKDVSLTAAGGASLALGFKKFFVIFEGGYELNKLDSLSRSGTLNNNVGTIDLSGSYFFLGLMFEGIPVFTK